MICTREPHFLFSSESEYFYRDGDETEGEDTAGDGPSLSPQCPQQGTVAGRITAANVIAGATASQQLGAGDLAAVITAIRAGAATRTSTRPSRREARYAARYAPSANSVFARRASQLEKHVNPATFERLYKEFRREQKTRIGGWQSIRADASSASSSPLRRSSHSSE